MQQSNRLSNNRMEALWKLKI